MTSPFYNQHLSSPRLPSLPHVPIRIAAIIFAALFFVVLDFIELGLHGSSSSPSPSSSLPPSQGGVDQGLDLSLGKNALLKIKKMGHYEKKFLPVLWRGAMWKEEVGNWLQKCHKGENVVEIVETVYGAGCPGACGGNGVCNFQLGDCRCASGFKGLDCTELEKIECNHQPVPHESQNEPHKGSVASCMEDAFCDKTIGLCRCGPNTPFPMRSIPDQCGTIRTDMGPVWNEALREDLFSNDTERPGWCFADPVKMGRIKPRKLCYCSFDGQLGELCEIPIRHYCVNGCNNRGICDNGYCQCESGFYGVDCSIPSILSFPVDEKSVPWLWPPSSPFPISFPPPRSLGEETSTSPLEITPPVLKEKEVGKGETKTFVWKRKRPLIYVYELPGEFNSHILRGRPVPAFCVPWTYNPLNETEWLHGFLYGMEPVLYELILSSQHRTTNGDEADFFFVPVLGGCLISRSDLSPHYVYEPRHKDIRPHVYVEYAIRAYEYIRDNFPHWNRTGGRDHLWTFPWDEGSCYAPKVIRNSTLLSSFGNTGTKYKKSTTAYGADNWTIIPLELRGDDPCFDPIKDIVLPAWKAPVINHIRGRLWARPFEERQTLFYFNGNLGLEFNDRPEPLYSMGIRQKVAYYFASIKNKDNRTGVKAEEGVIVTNRHSPDYGQQLSSSRFCGVFPGDGFSARMEDSMVHGCIPLIIQDGIQMPFENFLNYSTFAVRIAEDHIPNMIDIIKAIPEALVRSMLHSVQRIWQRWTYHSSARLQGWREREWYGHQPFWAPAVAEIEEDDAFSTLLQVLHYKSYNDPWRIEQTSQKGKGKKKLGNCYP